MCGLIGIITNETTKGALERKKLFEELLFADTLRGPHGTGVFVTEHGTEKEYLAEVYKKAMHAPDFLQLKAAQNLIAYPSSMSCMIGHNRWATSGGVHDHTSHPFQHGNITMVHNGTLHYHDNLQDGKNFAVDSEAICYSISEVGIEETAKKLDGAFALIWHDATDGTLNMLRNDERPLAFAKLKNQDTWVLASEGPMLRWILDRNKVETSTKILSLNTGAWVTFDLANPTNYTHKMIELSTDIDDTWGNYYKTTSNKNLSAYETLKKAGLKKGDTCTINVTTAGIIGTTGNRALDGYIQGHSAIEAVVYSVDAVLADTFLGKQVTGEIQSAYSTYNNGSNFISVTLRTESIKLATADNEVKIIQYDEKEIELQDLDLETPFAEVGSDDDVGIIMGPGGREITQKMYEEKTKHGCSFCQCDLPVADHTDVVWVDQFSLCPHCSETYDYGQLGNL